MPIAFCPVPFRYLLSILCFRPGCIMSTHYSPRDIEKMSAFYVGQIIRLFPYDIITNELKSSEDYDITKREGNFVTLTMTGKTDERKETEKYGKKFCVKTLMTRIGMIKNPPSEVISPDGYCPCYAYDYDEYL